jgi:hypothetical protein
VKFPIDDRIRKVTIKPDIYTMYVFIPWNDLNEAWLYFQIIKLARDLDTIFFCLVSIFSKISLH